MANWTQTTHNTASWTGESQQDTAWSTASGFSREWTHSTPSPVFGVPYNSDYLYDSLLTYNATEFDFEPIWLSNSRNTVDWTDL